MQRIYTVAAECQMRGGWRDAAERNVCAHIEKRQIQIGLGLYLLQQLAG